MATTEDLNSVLQMADRSVNPNVSGALQAGMGLAKTAQDLQVQRQQLEDDKLKHQVGVTGAFKGMADAVVRAQGIPELQTKLIEDSKARMAKIDPSIDTGMFDLLKNQRFAMDYAKLSKFYNSDPKVSQDPETIRQIGQMLQDANMFATKAPDFIQMLEKRDQTDAIVGKTAASAARGASTEDYRNKRAKVMEANSLRATNSQYSKSLGPTESGLFSADRATHLMEKIDVGDLQSNKMLRNDLTNQMASLVNGGRPSTVYGAQANELDSAYQNVGDWYNWLSGKAKSTIPPGQFDQLKADIVALRGLYGTQHENQYLGLREGLPIEHLQQMDNRANVIRTRLGLKPIEGTDYTPSENKAGGASDSRKQTSGTDIQSAYETLSGATSDPAQIQRVLKAAGHSDADIQKVMKKSPTPAPAPKPGASTGRHLPTTVLLNNDPNFKEMPIEQTSWFKEYQRKKDKNGHRLFTDAEIKEMIGGS